MLDEGTNPYESHGDSSSATYSRRIGSARSANVARPTPTTEAADKPWASASVRDFDFAAAMFKDKNAWREMARVIASDAA